MANGAIFDEELIEQFRKRARQKNKPGSDFLLAHICADLAERLADVKRYFSAALDLHGHNGLGQEVLKNSGKVGHITRVETDKAWLNPADDGFCARREDFALPERHFDLIISLFSLHLTNDTPATLVKIQKALKPDGLFLAVAPALGTLGELRASLLAAESEIYGGASPRIYPFIDVKTGGNLLQHAGFNLPVCDVDSLTVRYDNIYDIMADIRHMGMQNGLLNRSKMPVSRRFFARANEIYQERFSDEDGRLRASYNFIWFCGWAYHPDQQKPAKPGSAITPLAEALKKHQ